MRVLGEVVLGVYDSVRSKIADLRTVCGFVETNPVKY